MAYEMASPTAQMDPNLMAYWQSQLAQWSQGGGGPGGYGAGGMGSPNNLMYQLMLSSAQQQQRAYQDNLQKQNDILSPLISDRQSTLSDLTGFGASMYDTARNLYNSTQSNLGQRGLSASTNAYTNTGQYTQNLNQIGDTLRKGLAEARSSTLAPITQAQEAVTNAYPNTSPVNQLAQQLGAAGGGMFGGGIFTGGGGGANSPGLTYSPPSLGGGVYGGFDPPVVGGGGGYGGGYGAGPGGSYVGLGGGQTYGKMVPAGGGIDPGFGTPGIGAGAPGAGSIFASSPSYVGAGGGTGIGGTGTMQDYLNLINRTNSATQNSWLAYQNQYNKLMQPLLNPQNPTARPWDNMGLPGSLAGKSTAIGGPGFTGPGAVPAMPGGQSTYVAPLNYAGVPANAPNRVFGAPGAMQMNFNSSQPFTPYSRY